MFERTTPESVGIASGNILKFVKKLEKRGSKTHGILLARYGKIIYESYYKPYNQDSLHRMYSQTKSYVSIAIGLLEAEGKLSLKDKIIKHFPDKLNTEIEYLQDLTIEDMLLMSTAGGPIEWFSVEEKDRTKHYLSCPRETHPSGTLWSYDSTGSQVLSSLVERLSGKSLFDYLNENIFTHLGTFKNAKILKAPNGDSWGDSALICTLRDMYSVGQLLLQKGMHNGKQLIPSDYVERATSKLVDNREAHESTYHKGYGYQIWRVIGEGFAFVGMGDQLTACFPNGIVFCCACDNQGNGAIREIIFDALEEYILNTASDTPLLESQGAYSELERHAEARELYCLKGMELSPFIKSISGRTYICRPNKMGIKSLSLKFTKEDEGVFSYENEQGKKQIPFGINKNVFGNFPQYGYSQEYGRTKTTDGSTYKDAVSLCALEEKKLLMYVQIIDQYLGNLSIFFGFKGDELYATFEKTAEDFLNEYQGRLVAKQK